MVSLAPIYGTLGAAMLLATASLSATELDASHPVVTVGEQPITLADYVQQVRQGMRQRFYHGKVPQEQLEQYGEEVLQQMVDRTLLLQEAKRRQLQPDSAGIEAQLAGYDKQYADSERWQREREQRLPVLRARLEEQSLLQVLENEVRKVPQPDEKQIRAYYTKHPEKFTTPEKVRVSLILLKVDPSSPAAVWQAALEEGAAIVEKLRQGEDFAALARLHSGDESAERGGDLGYLHKGMLATEAQQAIDGLKPREIARPVRLLQGVAVLRLDDRTAAKLNPFEQVGQRAGELLVRDSGDAAWQALTAQLRQQTTVTIDRQTLKALFTSPVASAGTPKGAAVERAEGMK